MLRGLDGSTDLAANSASESDSQSPAFLRNDFDICLLVGHEMRIKALCTLIRGQLLFVSDPIDPYKVRTLVTAHLKELARARAKPTEAVVMDPTKRWRFVNWSGA